MLKKYVYLLRSTGTCIVFMGGCWVYYQLRQTLKIIDSVVPTNVLNMEQAQSQYIYVDDPQFQVLVFHDKNLIPELVEEKRNLTNTLRTWWKSLNRNLAYRLLHIAQRGSPAEHRKAVYSLSSLKYLKDWDYQSIAQMLDAKTAIALARTQNIDLRFFLKPQYTHMQHNPYAIIDNLSQLLVKLNTACSNCHQCLTKFVKNNFVDSHRDGLLFDHDPTTFGQSEPSMIVWDNMLLQSCIQAVYHHSSLDECSKDLVDAGGLQILLDVQKYFENEVNICIILAEILSNVSMYDEYLNEIHALGWIGVLARWAQSSDFRLSVSASRALANLHTDVNADEKYSRSIYPLHPLYKPRSKTTLDVVFIHGLLGGVFYTWRQRDPNFSKSAIEDAKSAQYGMESMVNVDGEDSRDFLIDLARDLETRDWERLGNDFEVILHDCPISTNTKASGPYTCKGDDICMVQDKNSLHCRSQCWPRDWLPEDVPALRILGVNYDTNLSMWTSLCPMMRMKRTIDERSSELAEKLLTAGIGKRPVIWVCHSMGGLLVKKILIEQWKSNDKNNICKNTRGIVFYSTPHRGSEIATLKQATQMLVWPSIEVQELRDGSPSLLTLHNDFMKMLGNYPIDIISFGETKPTLITALKFPLQFVNPISADPSVGEFFEIPQDHFSICKPVNRQSFLYRKLLDMIKRHHQFENAT